MNRNRLSSVLRIRRLQERTARGELAARRQAHRTAAAAEQFTWRLLDDRTAAMPSELSAPELLGDRAMVGAGVLAAATQRTTTAQAAEHVTVAVEHWTVAARRVEGLERLSERIRSAEQEEANRRVANEIDDLALVHYSAPHA